MNSAPVFTIESVWLSTLKSPLALVDGDGAVAWANQAWQAEALTSSELERQTDGSWQVSCSLPDEQGRYLIVAVDQTGWRETQRDRDKLMQLASLHDLIPTLLHELKNPLASIQAMVEVMIEDSDDDALRRSLHEVLINLRRLKLGFEGLGSFGRGLRSSRAQAIDFAVKETCHVLSASFRDRGVMLEYRIDPIPLLLLDSGAMRAIMYNLLNNALNACQQGDRVEVTLTYEPRTSTLNVCIEDTGCGMSESALARCTELFYTTRSNGSGIGLALCRRAVEEAGGSLNITSELGAGSRFHIQLPSKERSKQ